MLFSIIIPTLNEETNLQTVINSLRAASLLISRKLIQLEIIVVDGGSKDKTVEIANRWSDKTLITSAGRGLQMNAGAKIAKGDILVFLHADTLFQVGALIYLKDLMKNPNIIGGGFSKDWNWNPKIILSSFLTRSSWFWEGVGNWLVVLFRKFPGDNAIFVRKSVFFELKGFQNFWICEDLDFSYRMHSYCHRNHLKPSAIQCLDIPVLTSTRRFEEYGFSRIWIWWIIIFFLWRFGWNQDKLKNFTTLYLQRSTGMYRKRGNKLIL